MIVTCQNCGRTYHLNDRKLPKGKAKFPCRQCQQPVYINVNGARPVSDPKNEVKECPKCGSSLDIQALECPSCGIVLEKYKAYMEKKKLAQTQADQGDDAGVVEQQDTLDATAEFELDEKNMFCGSCGEKISLDDRICAKCGVSLTSVDDKATT